jgi:hypothetical protein
MGPCEYLFLAISGGEEVDLDEYYWGPDYENLNKNVQGPCMLNVHDKAHI